MVSILWDAKYISLQLRSFPRRQHLRFGRKISDLLQNRVVSGCGEFAKTQKSLTLIELLILQSDNRQSPHSFFVCGKSSKVHIARRETSQNDLKKIENRRFVICPPYSHTLPRTPTHSHTICLRECTVTQSENYVMESYTFFHH